MNKYRNREYVLNLDNYKLEHKEWVLNTKKWVNGSLWKNFHTTIDKLNEISYQIADIMLIHLFNNKSLTTIEEAQIIGCSQASTNKAHNKLTNKKENKSKVELLQLVKRIGKHCRSMKYVIKIIWKKISELKNLFRGINILERLISIHSLEKKLQKQQQIINANSDGLVHI